MSTEDEKGQVSEVSEMDPAQADTPIQPDQAVQGAPDMDGGDVQEGGEAGPNQRIDHELNRKDRAPGQKPASER